MCATLWGEQFEKKKLEIFGGEKGREESGRKVLIRQNGSANSREDSKPTPDPCFGPIDTGPEGGNKGSRVIFEGAPRCTAVGKAFADKPVF